MDGASAIVTSEVQARRATPSRQGLLDGLSDAIVITDEKLQLRLINDRARALLGLSADFPAQGRTLRQVLHAASILRLSAAEKMYAACLTGTNATVPSGIKMHIDCLIVTLDPVETGLWRITFAFAAPPTPSCDTLTGLADRAALLSRLQVLTSAADSDGAGAPCVLMVDLDRFKHVNDAVGFAVGDALLKSVAGRLRSSARNADLIARLGGDEFAIVLPAGTTAEAATQLATHVIDLVSRPYLVAGHLANVGASIGIAAGAPDAPDADTLLRNADCALYQAKREGRSRWCVYTPDIHERAQAQQVLEADLRRALAMQQFALHYQPQFSLRTRELTGFEALLRWPHPTRGMLLPDKFIPLAEEIGLIEQLGAWALRTACVQAASWPSRVRVAVNISPLQFQNGDKLLAVVRESLDRAGLPGDRLEIEITESALFGDESAARETLHALRRLGVRVAMDDFGTGYSSLNQLRNLPFQKIKIDQAFIRDVASDSQAGAIVRSINELAATLGMATIAEGVETEAQAQSLLQGGCADVQGYLISRPVPAEAVEAMIGRLTGIEPKSRQ